MLDSLFFGALQGLTEFLPISSSGHLLLLHSITNFRIIDDLTFDVALHLGTLLALLGYFWRDIISILRAWGGSFRQRPADWTPLAKTSWLLIIASIPAAIFGLALESTIESAIRAPGIVAVTMIIGGLFLAVADRRPTNRAMENLGWWDALWLGLGQAAALVPGISRAGATITVGRWLGFDRQAAARFSFLLAIPVTAGAGFYRLFKVDWSVLTQVQMVDLWTGLISAAVVGALAIHFLLRFVARRSYRLFVYYRLALGLAVLVWLWWP